MDAMLEETSLKTQNNLYIVDKSRLKRNFSIGNKQVYDPSLLLNEEFKLVIVACVDFYQEVKQEIEEKYPHVEKIVSIYDFVFNEV